MPLVIKRKAIIQRRIIYIYFAGTVNFLAKREALYIAIGAFIHNNAIVEDDNTDPQPAVSGYIEFAEEIMKISSVEDIERVLKRFCFGIGGGACTPDHSTKQK